MIRKFKYHDSEREVFVLEENDTSIKGIDLSRLDEASRLGFAEDLEKVKSKEIDVMKKYGMCYRHFFKGKIQDDSELEP